MTLAADIKPQIRAAADEELPPGYPREEIGLLPGDGDEYIITSGGMKGMRGFFTRDDSGAVVGIDAGGRHVPPGTGSLRVKPGILSRDWTQPPNRCQGALDGVAYGSRDRRAVTVAISCRLASMDGQVTLRPVIEDDLSWLAGLRNDPTATGPHEWHGWSDPQSGEETMGRIWVARR